MEATRYMSDFKAKIIIEGKIKLLTGLHIGGTDKDSGIGEIAYVIKDPQTGEPIIPGSSIKGKFRSSSELLNIDIIKTMLQKKLEEPDNNKKSIEKSINDLDKGHIHNCIIPDCPVCRLYGRSAEKSNDGQRTTTRLIVRDAKLNKNSVNNLKDMETAFLYTEVKAENNINRLTSAAVPRSIERVPVGAMFDLEMVYNVIEANEIDTDIGTIIEALEYIQDDYLGGNGTRGYGRVKFDSFDYKIRCINYYKNPENHNASECNECKLFNKESLSNLKGFNNVPTNS